MAGCGYCLAVLDDPLSPITRGCVLERPKVIHNPHSGQFVMWFHLELKDKGYTAAMAGTAVSDSPTGPFRFLECFRPHAGVWPQNATDTDRTPAAGNYLQRDVAGGQMSRDMTLLVDDDGSAYHITSAEENRTCHISRLTDDYLRPAGTYVRVFPERSMEAHAICKRKGRYHYIASGCTGWAPNQARSAVADHIFGPWQELGDPCAGVNPANGMGPEKTFGAQSTFLLPVHGTDDVIAMFDIWRPDDAIKGRYLWLPVEFRSPGFHIPFKTAWSL